MKKEFYGFYEPTSEEIEKSWKDGIFVFDANALLNMYRYSEATRKDFLLVITKLKDKLFMPYQVGHEFHTNRNIVIESQNKAYDFLIASIQDACEKSIQQVLNQYTRHPSIQIENLKKHKDDYLKKVNNELEKQRKNHPDFRTGDEIRSQLTELFEGKVGPQFNKNELEKIYEEGKERYSQQIPPGYKDQDTKRKKGEQNVYGDLIIWKQLISLAKKEKKEIILITDDRKEDWWTIENGKTIRPREELIKEFYDLTGYRILIYTADNFLHYAKERKLVTKIKDTSISEVKEVRKADEVLSNINDMLDPGFIRPGMDWYDLSTRPAMAELIKSNDVLKAATDWYEPASGSFSSIYNTMKQAKAYDLWKQMTPDTKLFDYLRARESLKSKIGRPESASTEFPGYSEQSEKLNSEKKPEASIAPPSDAKGDSQQGNKADTKTKAFDFEKLQKDKHPEGDEPKEIPS